MHNLGITSNFDINGVDEVRREILRNSLQYLLILCTLRECRWLYKQSAAGSLHRLPEIDRWIVSLLNTLVKNVVESFDNYDVTSAGREIQDFVNDNLSNWYVRLNRKRFWGGEMNEDKLSAYQTLYTCLETISILSAPLAPFFMERLFLDLNSVTGGSQ